MCVSICRFVRETEYHNYCHIVLNRDICIFKNSDNTLIYINIYVWGGGEKEIERVGVGVYFAHA